MVASKSLNFINQDIANAYAIYKVLTFASSLKILMVSGVDDIRASRGLSIRNSCEIIEQMISDDVFLHKSTGLVITRVQPKDINENFLSRVYAKESQLLQYLKEKESDFVFKFPVPSEFDVSYSNFTDKQRIIDFIHSGGSDSPKNIQIPLSNDAKLTIFQQLSCFGSLSDYLMLFIEKIKSNIDLDLKELDNLSQINENSASDPSKIAQINLQIEQVMERLTKLNDNITQFLSKPFPKPQDFVDHARNVVGSSNEEYENIFNSLIKIQSWGEFIEKIVGKDMLKNISSQSNDILAPIFLEISPFISKFMTPIKSNIEDKINNLELIKKANKTIEEKQKMAKLVEEQKKRNEELIEQREKELQKEKKRLQKAQEMQTQFEKTLKEIHNSQEKERKNQQNSFAEQLKNITNMQNKQMETMQSFLTQQLTAQQKQMDQYNKQISELAKKPQVITVKDDSGCSIC